MLITIGARAEPWLIEQCMLAMRMKRTNTHGLGLTLANLPEVLKLEDKGGN